MLQDNGPGNINYDRFVKKKKLSSFFEDDSKHSTDDSSDDDDSSSDDSLSQDSYLSTSEEDKDIYCGMYHLVMISIKRSETAQ